MRAESVSAVGSRGIGRVVAWLVVLALYVAVPARAQEPDVCSKIREAPERDIDINNMESWSASKNPRDARNKLRRWILDSQELLRRVEGAEGAGVMKWIPALAREVALTDSEQVRLARLDLLRFYQAVGRDHTVEDLLRAPLWKTRRSQRALEKELADEIPFTDAELARLTDKRREDLRTWRDEVHARDVTIARLEGELADLKERLSSEELSDDQRADLEKSINSTQKELEAERLVRDGSFRRYFDELRAACDELSR